MKLIVMGKICREKRKPQREKENESERKRKELWERERKGNVKKRDRKKRR